MKLAEIASRIQAHLRRFERDRKINKDRSGNGLYDYYCTSAFDSGARVGVVYIAYQSVTYLTKSDALRYLRMLDDGFVGRHWEAMRTPEWSL